MVTLITEKLQDQTLDELSTTKTVRFFSTISAVSGIYMHPSLSI